MSSESAVSLFITDGELDVQDQGNTTAEGLLKNAGIRLDFRNDVPTGRARWRKVDPDAARRGRSDRRFRHVEVGGPGFHPRTRQRTSLGKMIQYMPLEGEARVGERWKWLENLSEEQRLEITVPVLESPDRFAIVVVGADRAKTAVMPTGPSPVTVGIDQYRA